MNVAALLIGIVARSFIIFKYNVGDRVDPSYC